MGRGRACGRMAVPLVDAVHGGGRDVLLGRSRPRIEKRVRYTAFPSLHNAASAGWSSAHSDALIALTGRGAESGRDCNAELCSLFARALYNLAVIRRSAV